MAPVGVGDTACGRSAADLACPGKRRSGPICATWTTWSIVLDLQILWKTWSAVIHGSGAASRRCPGEPQPGLSSLWHGPGSGQ